MRAQNSGYFAPCGAQYAFGLRLFRPFGAQYAFAAALLPKGQYARLFSACCTSAILCREVSVVLNSKKSFEINELQKRSKKRHFFLTPSLKKAHAPIAVRRTALNDARCDLTPKHRPLCPEMCRRSDPIAGGRPLHALNPAQFAVKLPDSHGFACFGVMTPRAATNRRNSDAHNRRRSKFAISLINKNINHLLSFCLNKIRHNLLQSSENKTGMSVP